MIAISAVQWPMAMAMITVIATISSAPVWALHSAIGSGHHHQHHLAEWDSSTSLSSPKTRPRFAELGLQSNHRQGHTLLCPLISSHKVLVVVVLVVMPLVAQDN